MKLSRLGAYGLVVKKDRVLLLKKRGGPYLGLLDLPGGGIEKDEGPLRTGFTMERRKATVQ